MGVKKEVKGGTKRDNTFADNVVGITFAHFNFHCYFSLLYAIFLLSL